MHSHTAHSSHLLSFIFPLFLLSIYLSHVVSSPNSSPATQNRTIPRKAQHRRRLPATLPLLLLRRHHPHRRLHPLPPRRLRHQLSPILARRTLEQPWRARGR